MSLPGFDAIAGKLGGTAEQLFVWQVLGALLGAAMVPAINELQQLAYDAVPNAPISPADAATMVVRGFMSQSDAATEARLSGI